MNELIEVAAVLAVALVGLSTIALALVIATLAAVFYLIKRNGI